jgi:hypothetical protein
VKYLHLIALLLLAHSATAQQTRESLLDSMEIYQKAKKHGKAMVFAQELEKLLAEAKQTNTSDYAEVLDYMGDEHSRNNKYGQADSLYRVALAVREIIFGKIDSNYAISVGKLAILNLTRSQYKLAEPLQEQCIDILQKTISDI